MNGFQLNLAHKRKLFLTLASAFLVLIHVQAAHADRVWQYDYTDKGLLRTVDGPRDDVSDVTTYGYDSAGNLTRSTNALGHSVLYSNHDGLGLPRRIEDPNGTLTLLTYDWRGNVLTREVQTGQEVSNWTFQYDPVGQLIHISFPDGSALRYTFDAARRLTSVADTAGNRIEFAHDAIGNVTAEVIKNSSNVITKRHQRAFDELGRLISSIDADSIETRYGYDKNSNLTSIIDGNSRETRRTYDALDRLSRITDPLGGQVTFSYDSADNLTSVTDQRGLQTHYEYNFAGEVVAQQSPDTGITTFERDDEGNVTRKTDARGVITEYQYDALNRLTQVTFPADPGESIVYTYDDTVNGNRGIGRLTGIVDQSGSLSYRYDGRGNRIEATRTIEGQSYTTAYRYDLADNLSGITYPGGRIVTYLRDAAGLVSSVRSQDRPGAPEQVVVDAVTYLPFGPMQSLTFGNGLVRNVTYDQDYQITGIVSAAMERSYSYDLANNIQSITDLLDPSRTETFQYDALSRLTQATGTYGSINYDYDGVGNRTNRSQTHGGSLINEAYTYATDSNRLTRVQVDDNGAVSERNLNYTLAGNISEDQTPEHQLDLIYNQQNRLEEVHKNGIPLAMYIHNALGQRVIKVATNPEANRHFHYDQSGQLIAESAPDGSVQREMIYLNGVPVAVLATETAVEPGPEPAPEPPPEPEPEPANLVFEAEDGSWLNARVDTTHAGFSGTGFVDYLGEGYIEWTIDVPKAGNYAAEVRYALAYGSRPLDLQVDGIAAATLPFKASGSWTSWADQPGVIALTAGTHTVRLQSRGKSGANVDRLSLKWISDAPQSLDLEAERGAWTRARTDTRHDGYSGTGFVDYLGEGYLQWVVTNAEARDYTFAVRYALRYGSRPLDLQVNGTTVERLGFNATGSWTVWDDQTGTLALPAGTHVIRLQTTGSSGANVDRLRLTAIPE